MYVYVYTYGYTQSASCMYSTNSSTHFGAQLPLVETHIYIFIMYICIYI